MDTIFGFDLVGFDLDGTLVDSAGDLAGAVNHALSVVGRGPLALEQVKPMIGGGSRLMLQRALAATGGEEHISQLMPVMLDFYRNNIAVKTRAYPGVVDALEILRVCGVTLAIVTNKLEHLSFALLRELGLLQYFTTIIGGDTLSGKSKPDPAPIREMVRRCDARHAVFVGDSRYDVEAAHAAGLPIALYSRANALGADIAFSDYANLIPTLASLSQSSRDTGVQALVADGSPAPRRQP